MNELKNANIKAAKKLIKKYRSVTLDGIKKCVADGNILDYPFATPNTVKNQLTGFGRRNTCTLCISVDDDCEQCIYATLNTKNYKNRCYCLRFTSEKTYDVISDAKTPTTLRNAFRKRADFIEKLLEKL